MKSLQEIAGFYRNRFAYPGAFHVEKSPSAKLCLPVVIPCFDEEPGQVLNSLEKCSLPDPGSVEIILVLNHPEEAAKEIVKKHCGQQEQFKDRVLENGIPVYVIAAFDLPRKQAGVGLARKIGMDEALRRLASVLHDGLIVCLDADCTVSSNYLEELLKAEKAKATGLSIHFEHDVQSVESKEAKERIILYELFLRYYIHALRYARYFHAHHTVGSSMAVRASAYARIGGMNRRKAGEDFYFLHKLMPQGRFFDLNRCTVFPSARQSGRVPFGTGRAMLDMESGTKDFSELYHPQIFEDIRCFLEMESKIFEFETSGWPLSIREAFESEGWFPLLEQLKQRSPGREQLLKNFRHWLDGFKILRIVHLARDRFYGTLPAVQAVNQISRSKCNSAEEALDLLKAFDKDSPFRYF